MKQLWRRKGVRILAYVVLADLVVAAGLIAGSYSMGLYRWF